MVYVIQTSQWRMIQQSIAVMHAITDGNRMCLGIGCHLQIKFGVTDHDRLFRFHRAGEVSVLRLGVGAKTRLAGGA